MDGASTPDDEKNPQASSSSPEHSINQSIVSGEDEVIPTKGGRKKPSARAMRPILHASDAQSLRSSYEPASSCIAPLQSMADDWLPFDCDWSEFSGRPIHDHYCGNPLPQEMVSTSACQEEDSQQLQMPFLPVFSEQFRPMQYPVFKDEYMPTNILQEQLQQPLQVTPQCVDQFNPISQAGSSQKDSQQLQMPGLPGFSEQPMQYPVSTNDYKPTNILQEQLQQPLPVTPQYVDQFKSVSPAGSSQYSVQFKPIPTTASSQYALQSDPLPSTSTSAYVEEFQPVMVSSTKYNKRFKQVPLAPHYAEHLKPISVPVSLPYADEFNPLPAIVTSQYAESFMPRSVLSQYADRFKPIPATVTSPYAETFEEISITPPYTENSVPLLPTTSPTYAQQFKATQLPASPQFSAQSQTITISISPDRIEEFKADPLPISTQSSHMIKPSTSKSCLPISSEFKPPQPSISAPCPHLLSPLYAFPQRSRASLALPKGETPREVRNKAEKQRRDKLNQSIAQLASMVPPVLAASRKVDKTGVLRLTAHYLRAHQYVFGDSLGRDDGCITYNSAMALLHIMNGFVITTTYKGIIVVASQNVIDFLGYSELELLGQNVFTIVHEEDHQLLREKLMPKPHFLGPNGELLVPEDPEEREKMIHNLSSEKRQFVIRFKKLTQRFEPVSYLSCFVEGSLRKADRACKNYNRCCQMIRRVRARADSNCRSGNDVVFVGLARPSAETFRSERELESFRMEYKTRHSIDGEIIQVEQKISLVAGYMTHEVEGVNAMNFMHKDDVRWVIFALREMYDQQRVVGESCYRLMAKNGQLLYMKTHGKLEVDLSSRAVTTFICTNTVVDEIEGRYLINEMKQRFIMLTNDDEDAPVIEEALVIEDNQDDCPIIPVEDPKQLEKVILHLVTNLPSPASENDGRSSTPDNQSPSHLSIIPPEIDKIVSAINKSYSVIKVFDKPPELIEGEKKMQYDNVAAYRNNGNNSNNTPKRPLQSFGFTFPNKAVLGEPLDRNSFVSTITNHDLGMEQLEDDPGLGTSHQSAPKRPNDCDMTDIFHKKKMGMQEPAETFTPSSQMVEGIFDGMNTILDTGDTQLDTISTMNLSEQTNNQTNFPGILLDSEFGDILNNVDLDRLEQNPDGPSRKRKNN